MPYLPCELKCGHRMHLDTNIHSKKYLDIGTTHSSDTMSENKLIVTLQNKKIYTTKSEYLNPKPGYSSYLNYCNPHEQLKIPA